MRQNRCSPLFALAAARPSSVALWLLAATLAAVGCGWQSGERGTRPGVSTLKHDARAGTIVVEACQLEAAQIDSLKRARSLGVATDVVLVCAQASDDGSVHLLAGVSPEGLDGQVAALRSEGYRVLLGLTFGGGPGVASNPAQASKLLSGVEWRARVVEELTRIEVDGYELAFPQLMNGSRNDLTAFAQALSSEVRPARTVGVFAPPTASEPSDVPGGDAYDLPSLRPYLDRFRLMTLDFSCCGAGPGPTTDPLWAAGVVQIASGKVPERMVDVAIPLYGVHFWPGEERYVSYAEAQALSEQYQAPIHRTELQVPHLWFSEAGRVHEVWFDDQGSVLSYLASWKPVVIPAAVGVVYYGVGGEDPELWPAIAEARR